MLTQGLRLHSLMLIAAFSILAAVASACPPVMADDRNDRSGGPLDLSIPPAKDLDPRAGELEKQRAAVATKSQSSLSLSVSGWVSQQLAVTRNK